MEEIRAFGCDPVRRYPCNADLFTSAKFLYAFRETPILAILPAL
jgi:hypothetical protein